MTIQEDANKRVIDSLEHKKKILLLRIDSAHQDRLYAEKEEFELRLQLNEIQNKIDGMGRSSES